MAPKRKRTSSSTGTTYQVFLSFRGSDTRQGFADVLYHVLTDAGIHVFRDDEEIRKGEYISEEILGAIRESRIFVPIFSSGYASSKWCLMELSKMFESMEASPESGKKILPVFYDLSVDDVKLKKKGPYAKALKKHMKKFSADTVKQWKEALQNAGRIKGYEVKDTGHGEFAKRLAREISMKLKVKHKYVTEYLVQRDDQVEALMEVLDIEASGVRFVGIHGMGGIGKTTLATVVFNEICCRYDCFCFIADVRESSQQYKGIENLQKQLLRDLGHRSEGIVDVNDGIKQLKQNFLHKKVLIVLDGVDHKKQIQNLAGDASWFGSGSRIIITTRNQEALGKGVRTFEVVEMESDEALKLFSMHAFAEESPPIEYLSLSKEAVESTGRLPLALEVIGSHLGDKPRKDWTKTIKRLKKVPHKDVQEKLMISYKALDHGTKQIFLDIACFFIGRNKTLPLYMWEACDFDAKMELKVLIHMSLVKIDVGQEIWVIWRTEKKVKMLWMHDQLRDLGREIIRVESFKNGVKSSRLWMSEDAFEVLQEEEGKKDVEMLNLCKVPKVSYQLNLSEKEFSGFHKLRYLECCNARITGDWSRLLPELRWISCIECSLDVDFTGSSLKKLAVLDLSRCKISEDWSGWSQIVEGNKLKVLDLSFTFLRKTPDLSKFPNLERLILVGCFHLVEIDPSIGKLKGLKFLIVHGWESLGCFSHEELSSLNNLEVTQRNTSGEDLSFPEVTQRNTSGEDLSFSEDYLPMSPSSIHFPTDFYMPESIGNLGSLSTLELCYSPITELPESIGRLSRLRRLSLSHCSCLRRLPISLADMKSLVELCLSHMNISELPQRVGQLVKLEILELDMCQNMKKLPDSIGDMTSLVKLDLSLSGITEFPATIGMLKRLEVCNATACGSLAEIPLTIKGCTRLMVLNLSKCGSIQKLPDSVGDLKLLTKLYLSCTGISELPDTIGNLEELRVIDMGSTRIQTLPTSFGMLKRLEKLHVKDCKFLTEIPLEIEGCTRLRVLDLRGTGVNQLPPKLPPRSTDVQIGKCHRQKACSIEVMSCNFLMLIC